MGALFLVLPVGLPLAGGFLSFFLRFRDERSRFAYMEAVTVVTSVCVLIALLFVGPGKADLFSFTYGYSLSFGLDGMSRLFSGLIAALWPFALLYAYGYMAEEKHRARFFAFYVMTYGVALGVAFAADMITLYVFFEMLSLVTVPLVTHYGDHDSMYAGRKYAAYTIGGASLAFFAVIVATVYGQNGQFIYGGSLNGTGPKGLLEAAFVLGFFGFAAKAAIFPLFDWLPTASAAPTPVTALLHAVAVVNTGVFAVGRLTFYVFGPELLEGRGVTAFCRVMVLFSLIFGAVMAIRERHLKRRLAYSTMSNLSYMLFGILLLTPEGLSAGLSHMVFHSLTKMVLFLCAGAFMHQTGRSYVYELGGVGRYMKVTAACFTAAALSLMGMPLSAGFISKWALIRSALEKGDAYALAGVACLIAASFLCAAYTLSISIRAYFPAEGKALLNQEKAPKEAGMAMRLPILVFTGAVLFFGLWPGALMGFLNSLSGGI